jgi:NAD(P)-dependent dehydrogenase (short-subunit alcohol dehydrogenase family)
MKQNVGRTAGPDALDSLLDRLVAPGFTRIGYGLRKLDPNHAGVDGRTIVVTGATAGLGRVTASTLARLGATVVAVGRSPEKLAALASESDGKIITEVADLSLLSEVSALATRLLEEHPSIHVLINNVGAMFGERTVTAEGLERTFATNLAGQFLLTNRLIPRLIESAPARVITVSSGGMYTAPLAVNRLESPDEYRPSVAYARTKRAQVVLSEIWAEQLAGTGVVSHAMHPGWSDTPGVQESLPGFRRITAPWLRSPEQGADTIVWLATAEEPSLVSGLFWHDRKPRPTHRLGSTAERPGARQELWTQLETLTTEREETR